MSVSRQVFPVVLVLMLAGCAGRAGVEEFRIYSRSVDAVAVASEPIVAQIRIAERHFERERIREGRMVLGKQDKNARTNGYVEEFYPEHAVFFTESIDPPYTAAMVYSLATIVSYNRSLLLYADGAALAPLLAELGRVETEAGNALTAIGIATAPALATASPALTALREGARLAIQAASREAFRTELLARDEQVHALLDALIASSRTTFELLTRNNVKVLRRASGDARTQELKKLELKRLMLSEWVIALERAKIMLNKAVVAASTDGDPVAVFAGAADTFAEIRASAARIRDLSAQGSF